MRRVMTTSGAALASGCVALAVAALTWAAQPKPATHFSGRGKLCENNAAGGRYTNCSGHDQFSFQTSSTGSRVRAFKALIGPFYCGGGSSTIKVKSMKVGAKGSFSKRFSGPNIAFGKRNGTYHVKVRGRFTSPSTATVSYQEVIHFNSTSNAQDCGARVRGVAHAK